MNPTDPQVLPYMQPEPQLVDDGPFPPPSWFGEGPAQLTAPTMPLAGMAPEQALPEQAPQLQFAPEQEAPLFQSQEELPPSAGYGFLGGVGDAAPAQPSGGYGFLGGVSDQPRETAPQEQQPADPFAQGVNSELKKSDEAFAADNSKRESEREQVGLDYLDTVYGQNREDAAENARIAQEADEGAKKETEALAIEAKRIAETKEDRGRLWQNMGTGGKIASMLSAWMGGLLAPYRGGQNQGLDLIMKAIDDDVAAQRQDIANQKAGLGERRGLLADQRTADHEMWKKLETKRLAGLENVEQEAKVLMGQFRPEGTQYARAAQMVKDVQAQKAKSYRELEDRDRKWRIEQGELRVKQSQAHTARLAQKESVRQFDLSRDDKARELEVKAATEGAIYSTVTGKPMGSAAAGKEAAGTAQTALIAHTAFRRKVAEMNAAVKAYGVGYDGAGADKLGDTQRANLNRLTSDVRSEYGKILSGASVSKEQQADILKMFPSVEGWTQRSNPGAVLDGWLSSSDAQAEIRLKGAGLPEANAKAIIKEVQEEQNFDTGTVGQNQDDRLVASSGLASSDPDTVKRAIVSLNTTLADNPSNAADPDYESGLANAEKVLGADNPDVKAAKERLQSTKIDALFQQEFPDVRDGIRKDLSDEEKMRQIRHKDAIR